MTMLSSPVSASIDKDSGAGAAATASEEGDLDEGDASPSNSTTCLPSEAEDDVRAPDEIYKCTVLDS